jgi:hypothetical protein
VNISFGVTFNAAASFSIVFSVRFTGLSVSSLEIFDGSIPAALARSDWFANPAIRRRAMIVFP